jgi:hypothetical protein
MMMLLIIGKRFCERQVGQVIPTDKLMVSHRRYHYFSRQHGRRSPLDREDRGATAGHRATSVGHLRHQSWWKTSLAMKSQRTVSHGAPELAE